MEPCTSCGCMQKTQDPLKTTRDCGGKACRALDEEKVLFAPLSSFFFFYVSYDVFLSFAEPATAD